MAVEPDDCVVDEAVGIGSDAESGPASRSPDSGEKADARRGTVTAPESASGDDAHGDGGGRRKRTGGGESLSSELCDDDRFVGASCTIGRERERVGGCVEWGRGRKTSSAKEPRREKKHTSPCAQQFLLSFQRRGRGLPG